MAKVSINDITALMPNAIPVRRYAGAFNPQMHLTIGYTAKEDKAGFAATIKTLREFGANVEVIAISNTGLGWSIEAQFADQEISGQAIHSWNSAFS